MVSILATFLEVGTGAVEYIRHVGTGILACPGGVAPGGFWGDKLLA